MVTLRPQTPKHIRGGWSHYTETSEPVDGNGAQNMSNPGFEQGTLQSLAELTNCANRAHLLSDSLYEIAHIAYQYLEVRLTLAGSRPLRTRRTFSVSLGTLLGITPGPVRNLQQQNKTTVLNKCSYYKEYFYSSVVKTTTSMVTKQHRHHDQTTVLQRIFFLCRQNNNKTTSPS
jgi:hypothetical protein